MRNISLGGVKTTAMMIRVLVISWWEMRKLGIAQMSEATPRSQTTKVVYTDFAPEGSSVAGINTTKTGRNRADIIGVAIYVRGRV